MLMAPNGYPVARTERLRAPLKNGDVLVAPRWDRADDLISANRASRDEWDYDVQGTALFELARAARGQILEAASEYTRSYAEGCMNHAVPVDPAVPIFLTGHQPELYHPGVWLKNFAIGRLANRFAGVGINLIIDADDVRSTDVRVPTGTPSRPRVESVPYDLPMPLQPYEERPIRDVSTFVSFGDRAARCVSPLVKAPLLPHFWRAACERSDPSNLGQSIAQARHLVEYQWGNRTLEIPQSRLCRLPAVRALFCHILAHLPRLHEVYNGALDAFRHRHAIKNHAQPMPNLESDGPWLEVPLWVWSDDRPTRQRLFARGRLGELELSDRHGWTTILPLSRDGDCRAAVDRLAELEQCGVKLRSRALVTTLVARLLCSDLFIHGIGGARYDEVTDELIREFFACVPPQFMVVSGTLHLPAEPDFSGRRDVRDWKQRLRELTYHPEVYLDEIPIATPEAQRQADSIVADKRRWIGASKTPQTAHERHLSIQKANRQLQTFVRPLVSEAEAALEMARCAQRARQILQSREYAFCLYPPESLKRLLLSLDVA